MRWRAPSHGRSRRSSETGVTTWTASGPARSRLLALLERGMHRRPGLERALRLVANGQDRLADPSIAHRGAVVPIDLILVDALGTADLPVDDVELVGELEAELVGQALRPAVRQLVRIGDLDDPHRSNRRNHCDESYLREQFQLSLLWPIEPNPRGKDRQPPATGAPEMVPFRTR